LQLGLNCLSRVGPDGHPVRRKSPNGRNGDMVEMGTLAKHDAETGTLARH